MELLTEIEVPKAIRQILEDADTAKFAVAFWGKDAAETLGISACCKKTIKIICNLQSGACNPAEIRKLLGMSSTVYVKTNPRLHAKVYWTPKAVVIGSSNASANGLAVEGNELSSWSEANVYTSDNSMLGQTSDWFDEQFDQSQEITETDLHHAEKLWKSRQYDRPLVFAKNASLIQVVRDNIGHPIWKTVKVTCWQDDLSEDAASRLSIIAANYASPDELLAYEGWEDYLKEGYWTFDFYINPNATISFNDIWKIMPYLPSSPDLSLAVKSSSLDLKSFGLIIPTREDLAGLKQAAVHFLDERKKLKLKAQDGKNAVFDIAEAVRYLDAKITGAKPTGGRQSTLEKEFQLAMQNVYEEAKKIGHNATKFLRMLHTDGAVKTAEKLVTGSASETFTKFILKGRKDLTVEALIVQERWQPLFSEDVVNAAKKRLSQ